MIKEKRASERKYRDTSFYCASLYGVLQMLHFPKKKPKARPSSTAKAFPLALLQYMFECSGLEPPISLPVTALAGLWKTSGCLAEGKYCNCREHFVLSAVQQLSSFRQR